MPVPERITEQDLAQLRERHNHLEQDSLLDDEGEDDGSE